MPSGSASGSGPTRRPAETGAASRPRVAQLLERVEGRPDDLVHVEVAVLRQAADEGHPGLLLGQAPVERREGVALRAGNGVVRVALAGPVLGGELAHEVGAAALLAGDVLQLDGPRERLGAGVVHLEDRLDEAP